MAVNGIARIYPHTLVILGCVWIQSLCDAGRVHLILRETRATCGQFPVELEPGYDQVTSAPLLISVPSAVLWTMELIHNVRNVTFLEGVCPAFLSVSLSCAPSLQPTHAGHTSPPRLFPNLHKYVVLRAVSNMLWEQCKNSLVHWVMHPWGQPGKGYWETA